MSILGVWSICASISRITFGRKGFSFFVLGLITADGFVIFCPHNQPNGHEEQVPSSSGVTQHFKVVINDAIVIDEAANVFTGSLEEKGKYRGKEVKLIVTYSSGFLGIGSGYEAMVFISNELAAKFKF